MYTYKLGGMLITDELYHDDLEAMTFGRKDQNELMHYGIKGQSWGKRRFQNEDGSLTMAGRSRYDVGDPLQGSTNRTMATNRTYATGGGAGGFGGASGGGGSVKPSGSRTTRLSGSIGLNAPGYSTSYHYETNEGPGQSAGRTVTNKVKAKLNDTVNNGRKAADNLFSSIGNWATNAAKDVGNFATNTYNDASKAVTNAANDAGNAVKNVAQGVSDWYTGDKNAKEAQRYDNVVQNFERAGDANVNAGQDIISRGLKYPESAYDLEPGQSMRDKTVIEGLDRRNLGFDQHDIARQYGQKADEAQARYDAAPRQVINSAAESVGNAAKDAGNWLGNAFNDAKNWVGDRAQDVGKAAVNAYKDANNFVDENITGNSDRSLARSLNMVADAFPNSDTSSVRRSAEESQAKADNSLFGRIGNAAKDVGDWASNAASDVANWGAGAIDKGKTAVSNFFSELVNPHYNLNANDMKTRYEEILAELPKGDIARIRYYGNSQGDQDALREQAIESIKRGR